MALRKLGAEMHQSNNLVFNPKSKRVTYGTLSKAYKLLFLHKMTIQKSLISKPSAQYRLLR